MAIYVVESYDWQVLHNGMMSDGVLGQQGSSEKIYLHLLELQDNEISQLCSRVDENGNSQSDRLALPRNEEWWIATAGEKFWPKTARPKVASSCTHDANGVPSPRPITSEERQALQQAGASFPG